MTCTSACREQARERTSTLHSDEPPNRITSPCLIKHGSELARPVRTPQSTRRSGDCRAEIRAHGSMGVKGWRLQRYIASCGHEPPSVMVSPFTFVPLEEPLSVTLQPPSALHNSSACRCDTSPSLRHIAVVLVRPTMNFFVCEQTPPPHHMCWSVRSWLGCPHTELPHINLACTPHDAPRAVHGASHRLGNRLPGARPACHA